MAKIALTVRELIEKLTEIDNKDLEVWLKGDNGPVTPCDEISMSDTADYLILSNHIKISVEEFMKGMRK